MTVPELLERNTSRELAEWIAYAQIEPFGEERADLRIALLTCYLLMPYWKQGAAPPKLADFMLKFEAPEAQTMEEMKAVMQMMAAGSKM